MAEIKSTMERVMERLAAMDAAAGQAEPLADDTGKAGMRLAAGFLRGEATDFAAALAAQPERLRHYFRVGVVRTLLRNIVLPREAGQQRLAELAMQGLLVVGQEDGELVAVFGELKTVLDRYFEHRRQLRQQLVEHFAQQMGVMEQNLAAQTGVAMKLQPEQHPKFAGEWQRVLDELNGQYGRALNQYKELVQQRFRM